MKRLIFYILLLLLPASATAQGGERAFMRRHKTKECRLAAFRDSLYTRRFRAVKHNLAADAALVANLGFEFQIGRHFSLDIPVMFSPYDITPHRKVRLLATQPELRWWLGDEPATGWFLGLGATVAGFNVAINDHGRYQDPDHAAWGVGLGLGWATHLDRRRHWGLEVSAAGGYLNCRYDTYRNYPNGPHYRSGDTRHWWGPVRLAVALSYQWRTHAKERRDMR